MSSLNLQPIDPESKTALRSVLAGSHQRLSLLKVHLSCGLSGTSEVLSLADAIGGDSGWEGLWHDGEVVPVTTAARRRILSDTHTGDPLESGDAFHAVWHDGETEHEAYLSSGSLARLQAKIQEVGEEMPDAAPEVLSVREVGERASKWEFVKVLFRSAKR